MCDHAYIHGWQSCLWSAGQEYEVFPCPRSHLKIWSREVGSAFPSARLFSTLRLNLIGWCLSRVPFLPPAFRDTYYVCVFSSHPFWTSSSLDVPAGVTQEEGHTGFLIHLPSAVRALIFLARRIQPFLSLVDREVEFCVLTN